LSQLSIMANTVIGSLACPTGPMGWSITITVQLGRVIGQLGLGPSIGLSVCHWPGPVCPHIVINNNQLGLGLSSHWVWVCLGHHCHWGWSLGWALLGLRLTGSGSGSGFQLGWVFWAVHRQSFQLGHFVCLHNTIVRFVSLHCPSGFTVCLNCHRHSPLVISLSINKVFVIVGLHHCLHQLVHTGSSSTSSGSINWAWVCHSSTTLLACLGHWAGLGPSGSFGSIVRHWLHTGLLLACLSVRHWVQSPSVWSLGQLSLSISIIVFGCPVSLGLGLSGY